MFDTIHLVRRALGLISIAIVVAWNSCSGVAAPATESASGLLDDLDGDLFGPGESSKPLGDRTPNSKLERAPSPGKRPQLTPPLGGEDLGQPSEQSPLAAISSDMRQAERLIAQRNLAGETARIQEQVVGALDALINQVQQQNQSSSQSQSQSQQQQQQASQRSTPQPSAGQQSAGRRAPNAANAARTSSDRLESGTVDEAAGHGSQELLKDVWGQLPERVRQQLLQSSTDEFLPQYRDDIERYFRRLAEEESERSGPAER